jgi:hypothetical protein
MHFEPRRYGCVRPRRSQAASYPRSGRPELESEDPIEIAVNFVVRLNRIYENSTNCCTRMPTTGSYAVRVNHFQGGTPKTERVCATYSDAEI